MTWLLALLSTTWGRRVAYVLGSLAMLALGVAIGRFAMPRVVTVTKTEIVERIVKVKVKDRNVTRTTRTVTEPTPAGPKTTTETTTRATEHTTTDTQADTATRSNVSVSTGHRADWRVIALGGMLVLPSSTGTPQVSWLVGAGAERRIAGPISAGLWGMGGPKAGATGVSLSVEF